VPQIFVNGQHIGGLEELERWAKKAAKIAGCSARSSSAMSCWSKREDKHLGFLIGALRSAGYASAGAHTSATIPRGSRPRSGQLRSTDAVFSFGGIARPPDDHTRQCAAAALGVPLECNPEAERRSAPVFRARR